MLNPAQFAIEKKVISWLLVLILGVGGMVSFFGLGMLEDPPFTVKNAVVYVAYPGASAQQVEEEVSYRVEEALQKIPALKEIKSLSSAGFSQIEIEIENTYSGQELQQVWDEVRRKISDMKADLPPGTSEPLVFDDFGDVFGALVAVTGGDGFRYSDLKDYVDYVRRELILVPGVGKIEITGAREEQVFVEITTSRLTSLGIAPDRIFDILQRQNVVSNAGQVRVGSESIRMNPTGEIQSVEELRSVVISDSGASRLIYLGDIADIYEGYAEVPSKVIRYNGKEALLIGISFTSGVNVVDVGVNVGNRLRELEYQRPVGIDLHAIYNQPAEVYQSVRSFMVNLGAAVAIVIVVLLVFMGLRSGLLIGLILFLTCAGTFIFMGQMDIELQRISLGALIIALGMLVDNAIVVTEGVLIGMKRGLSKLQAANAIVKQTIWPLLGATVIAVLAFAPIGLSNDSTGEFAGSLFSVLLISLMLSWLTAITLTPFFCDLFFKEENASGDKKEEESDPYKGALFVVYRKLLNICMRFRSLTMILLVGGLVAALFAFGMVKQVFFPPSTTPIFLVDYWLPQGTDIRQTDEDITLIQQHLKEYDGVEYVAASIGGGAPRFMLTYTPEKAYASYAQLIIRMETFEQVVPMMKEVKTFLADHYPQASIKFRRLEIGPSPAAKIEARFIGPDPDVLRGLAARAKDIFRADPGASNIRDDWRERSKMIRPQFNESDARRLGISKQNLDRALLFAFSGVEVGLYRDGTRLKPIIARLPENERLSIDTIRDVQVFSKTYNRYVKIDEVVSSFETEWEDALIQRLNRKRTLTVLADQDIFGDETANDVFNRIRTMIEAIELSDGYALEWGGEYESSYEAQSAIFVSLPVGYLLMFIITIVLFNALRPAMVIWACVPLAMIGISVGLLVMGVPFGFMALLGMLSLSGMLIKNGIVLVDQINTELATGMEPYKAVFMSGVSRVRPVSMAAITTILGMLPLLRDAFFESMAVTIMFGLGFATILTLVVVPVLYTMFHGIKYRSLSELEG